MTSGDGSARGRHATIEASPLLKRMGTVEWLLLLVLSVLWGGSFFFNRIVLAELPPMTLVLGRVALAAIAINVLVVATGHRMPRSPRRWGAFVITAILNNVLPFVLIVWGQTRITSGLAAILYATAPVWAIVLAHLFTHDERLRANKLAGVLFGVIGVAVLVGPTALDGLSLNALAQIAVLGAALSYALSGIYGRRFAGTPPLVVASGQITAATVLVLPLTLVIDQPWTLPAPHVQTWAALFGLALLSTILGYTLYFRILATAGATNLVLVTFLMPVTALLLGTIVLGEPLEPRHLVGMGLIGIGLAAIDGRLLTLVCSLTERGTR